MISLTWSLVSGEKGEVQLEGDQKWTFGRGDAAGDPFHLTTPEPNVSRTAVVIRDSGPGPVVFRGQRENGSQVAVVQASGSTAWLAEGTAHNLTPDAHLVEFYNGEELFLTIDVAFDRRPTAHERLSQNA